MLSRVELWKAVCFHPCRSIKVLGSWCKDCGGSSGPLLASLQAGNSVFYKHEGLLRDKTLPIAGRAQACGSACTASTPQGSETLHLGDAGLRELKGWEGRDALDTINTKNELKGVHTSVLLRLHKWARVALNLQWRRRGVLSTQSSLAPQRPSLVGTDTGGRGPEECEATRMCRHGTNTPMRRWEVPFVESFGVDWKQCATANDGAPWHESCWDFDRTFLKKKNPHDVRCQRTYGSPTWRRSDWQAEKSRKKRRKASRTRTPTTNLARQ